MLLKYCNALLLLHYWTSLVSGVCPSVCLSVTRLSSASLCKNGWTDQDPVWGEHSWGPKEHCFRWGAWFLSQRGIWCSLHQITVASCLFFCFLTLLWLKLLDQSIWLVVFPFVWGLIFYRVIADLAFFIRFWPNLVATVLLSRPNKL